MKNRRFRHWLGLDELKPIQTLSGALAEHNRRVIEDTRLYQENQFLTAALAARESEEKQKKREQFAFVAEMVEAQAMCGSGPWAPGSPEAYAEASKPLQEALKLIEAGPVDNVGTFGLYALMLQNIGWQQELNYSQFEFTRWGIQQIILICRLYYLKNPIPRRLVDVGAQYVFARGVTVSTPDDDANDVWNDFLARNQKVLGHTALMELEKTKDRDGNLFFCFFSDAAATGETDIRIIDATEIQDIWCDPEDSDVPRFYRREWVEKTHDAVTGSPSMKSRKAWYPAIGYNPETKPEMIGNIAVKWDAPVYHRKVGTVGKWVFGCPRIYPMIDWAREAKRFLEACASVRASLSQFAFDITTKGGQQAIEGIKQQVQSTLGPGMPGWDANPPSVAGASFIHGSGTSIDAFKVQGATFSPEDVRQYKLMCCMVKGYPETFLADVSTGNLATATSLDRPTETVILSQQEEWREDLVVIATRVLNNSLRATKGKLREAWALKHKGITFGEIKILEAKRKLDERGNLYYVTEKAPVADSKRLEIEVDFPSIREGDANAETDAIVNAMTLANKGGIVCGIDEKEGVKLLFKARGVENGNEIADKMYPDYDPDRTKIEDPPPIGKVLPTGGVQPTPADAQEKLAADAKGPVKEAFAMLADAVERVFRESDAS